MSDQPIATLLRNDTDHLWHVWINQYAQGESEKGKPRPHSLYEFKSMLQALPWLGRTLGKERKGELPKTHRQCSRCAPEHIHENHLECCLGVKCAECPILISLRTSIAARSKEHYKEITDEDVDHLCGLTCAWHIFTTATGTPADHWGCDTSEGYIKDESDRMFWSNLYKSLSGGPPA